MRNFITVAAIFCAIFVSLLGYAEQLGNFTGMLDNLSNTLIIIAAVEWLLGFRSEELLVPIEWDEEGKPSHIILVVVARRDFNVQALTNVVSGALEGGRLDPRSREVIVRATNPPAQVLEVVKPI